MDASCSTRPTSSRATGSGRRRSISRARSRSLIRNTTNSIRRCRRTGGGSPMRPDQSGRYEIYVQEFNTGAQRTLVSTQGGMQPRWRADGRELFYVQLDGSLMRVAFEAGASLRAAAPVPLFKTPIPPVLNPYRMDYVVAADGQRFLMKVPLRSAEPADHGRRELACLTQGSVRRGRRARAAPPVFQSARCSPASSRAARCRCCTSDRTATGRARARC